MCRFSAHLGFKLIYKKHKNEENATMKTIIAEKAFYSGEDYENCYLFSPSVSRRETLGGKYYYVRRYFRGGKDFEQTMERLAVNQVNKAG